MSRDADKKRRVTLLYLFRGANDHAEVLLAMKKRGFGQGWWNGTGGKIEAGETARAAAIRETSEEIGVTPIDPQLVAQLTFDLPDDDDVQQIDCQVFRADQWQGEPRETEEMRPAWFTLDRLPLSEMWPSDIYWLPHMLEGKLVTARITINGQRMVLDQQVTVVHSLPDSL